MDEFEFEEHYDGVDDNIEILLEDALNDPEQAYLYLRIRRNVDEDGLVRTFGDDGEVGANCDEFTILTSGTIEQYAVMFLQLFELDETYIDAVAAAVKVYQDLKGNQN
jgi:hypothetical protein